MASKKGKPDSGWAAVFIGTLVALAPIGLALTGVSANFKLALVVWGAWIAVAVCALAVGPLAAQPRRAKVTAALVIIFGLSLGLWGPLAKQRQKDLDEQPVVGPSPLSLKAGAVPSPSLSPAGGSPTAATTNGQPGPELPAHSGHPVAPSPRAPVRVTQYMRDSPGGVQIGGDVSGDVIINKAPERRAYLGPVGRLIVELDRKPIKDVQRLSAKRERRGESAERVEMPFRFEARDGSVEHGAIKFLFSVDVQCDCGTRLPPEPGYPAVYRSVLPPFQDGGIAMRYEWSVWATHLPLEFRVVARINYEEHEEEAGFTIAVSPAEP